MSVQAEAVKKAMRWLDAAGALYAIQFEGETFGVLEVAVPKVVKRRHTGLDYYAIYEPHLRDLPPMGRVEFETPDTHDPETMRGSMCAYATKHWGKGTYITKVNVRTVSLLRIE